MNPGTYTRKFSHKLPKDLPFSMKEECGEVAYSATVVLFCSDQNDLKFKYNFVVLPVIDLNGYPQLKVPCTQKAVCGSNFIPFLPTKTRLIATLPRKAYARGETIDIEAQLDNSSDGTGIVHFKITLYKVVEFDSRLNRIPPKKLETEISKTIENSWFAKKTEKYLIHFPIPSNIFPNTHKSTKIIKVTYCLKIMAKV